MTEQEIAKRLATYVKRNYLFDDNKVLDHGTSLINTGILDSTGILELIAFVEEDFGVVFEDDELTGENFDSVDRIVSILMKKIRNGSGDTTA